MSFTGSSKRPIAARPIVLGLRGVMNGIKELGGGFPSFGKCVAPH